MGLKSGIRKKPIPDPGSGSKGQKGTGSATLGWKLVSMTENSPKTILRLPYFLIP
jgi:hypothetical protein